MEFLEEITPSRIVLLLILFFFLKYNWNRRWLYYYGWKLDGPFSWPLIGSSLHFWKTDESFVETFVKMAENYSSVFKIWAGSHLIIVNTKPQDVEILLNRYLEKAPLYEVMEILLKEGLLTGNVNTWKNHRKMITHSFNTKILNSFIDVFNKYTNNLVEAMKMCCVENRVDMFPKFFRFTLDMACETLLDVDSGLISGQEEFISRVIRIEERGIKWIFAAAVFPKMFWKYSKIFQYLEYMSTKTFNFTKNVIELKNSELPLPDEKEDNDEGDIKNKRFLNHLIHIMKKNNSLTDEEILEEVQTMLITASESTAITLCFTLIALALNKDIQDKVYEELVTIFEGIERDATLEDLNKMEYLERVLKETMRIMPPAPVIGRYIDEDIELDSVVYPKGSCIMVPMTLLHNKPEYWNEPLKFDPDRFLPEETKKRHRCAYIPFSYGPRNCIGFVYGMMSMKVMLSKILRKYEIVSVNHKSLNEIKLIYSIIVKPKDGCNVLVRYRK